MTGADADYLADVEYTGDFFPHLAPARLACIAAINGYRPPPLDRPFTWCELSWGSGTSASRYRSPARSPARRATTSS